ncbi:cytochrome p450 domain-containing protein [Phthorimaea operculella]|nr:cytochrome p450 domain-containing protein [Phthorimaea operculella]
MNVIKERQYKASTRNDFVDLVLNLKQQEYLKSESILVSKKGEIVSLKVDDELLVAQIVLFFAAGFETTSSTTSYTLYQLAMHQEAQEKARAEVDEYLKRTGGKIEYDCVSQLPFLEACIEEGMRMYPALGLLTREVMDTYELPTGLKLEPGTMVHLPVYHLHNNPEYFPDPEKYRPERFLPENKANIKPYTYMPFGEGQRICLGIRVAKMQMIPGMITIFRKYKFELAEGVPKKLAFQPRTVVTQSIEELRLKFIPRDVTSKWNFNYWKKRNVPYLKPQAFFGNYKDYLLLRKTNYEVAQDICRQFPKEPYIGTFYGTKPALIIQDPELIKLITAKDYAYFSGRAVSKYADREILTRNMFFTYGDRWKVIRQNTSPLFTVARVKSMFPLIEKCINTFEHMLKEIVHIRRAGGRSLMGRYTMDCIGSIGFGVDTDTMGKEISINPFRRVADLIFNSSNLRGIAIYTRNIWPALFYGLGLSLFPKTITDFFFNLITGVFKERGYKPSIRNDFVDLLLNLKQQKYLTCESILKSKEGELVKVEMDDEFLVAQIVLIFSAGFETSASTTSFTLYLLAKHQEAQKKALEEVDNYLKRTGGKIEYECVTEMPYLEACIQETMRFYPALGLLTREVVEPYELPSGLKLEPGLRIHLPVYSSHHNPEYFPEPEEFKPERFLPENRTEIKPCTYMPFGEGQRLCLGIKVAKMQMIPGLMTILRKYRVELADGMPRELTLEPTALVAQSREKLRLKFIPRG